MKNFKRNALPFLARMAANQTDLEALLAENFSCKICSQILSDPVQCQNKEHYYCRRCITSRLRHAKTCPLCKDDLSLETLRPPSRIVANVVSQLKKPRCSHVSRGCREDVSVEELLLHERTCGYAPVVSSNQGCKRTVNRHKESHEPKRKFRKITSESCDEEMDRGLYETYLREKVDRIKSRLTKAKKISKANPEEKLETYEMFEQSDRVESLSDSRSCSTIPEANSTALTMEGQIFIFGGSERWYLDWKSDKSVEVFDWSTRTWTLYEDCLHEIRCSSIVFLEGKKIMIYGGQRSLEIECLTPNKTGVASVVLPGQLHYYSQYNGVKRGNRVITFYRNVVETKLEPPYKSTVLLGESFTRLACAVVSIGRAIYIIGGQPSTVERYDVTKNELTSLVPVPYSVTRMACVVYEDNIIIIGGEDNCRCALNDVIMFNVTTQKYKKLPSMLEKRVGSAAVIKGNKIVVMGGGWRNRRKRTHSTKTVEYYVIGEDTWHELPEMNVERVYASALLYE